RSRTRGARSRRRSSASIAARSSTTHAIAALPQQNSVHPLCKLTGGYLAAPAGARAASLRTARRDRRGCRGRPARRGGRVPARPRCRGRPRPSAWVRGLVDTSVVVDWDDPGVVGALPQVGAISTITLAELAAGPDLARDPLERARRQARLQRVEAFVRPARVRRRRRRAVPPLARRRSAHWMGISGIWAAGCRAVPSLARRRSAHRGRGARRRAAALHATRGTSPGWTRSSPSWRCGAITPLSRAPLGRIVAGVTPLPWGVGKETDASEQERPAQPAGHDRRP